MLNNFGYSKDRAEKHLQRQAGGKPYDELTPEGKVRYDKLKQKLESFAAWFIPSERDAVADCLRELTACIYGANSIYPTCAEELIERRILQDKALGLIETLEKYSMLAEKLKRLERSLSSSSS